MSQCKISTLKTIMRWRRNYQFSQFYYLFLLFLRELNVTPLDVRKKLIRVFSDTYPWISAKPCKSLPTLTRQRNSRLRRGREKREVTSLANSFIPGRSAPVRHNPSICRRGVSRVMPLLAACNRVGGKESDSSERTARHRLYMNGRKKSHSIRRTFTVSSSISLSTSSSSLYSLPAPTRIFLPLSLPFASSLFILRTRRPSPLLCADVCRCKFIDTTGR